MRRRLSLPRSRAGLVAACAVLLAGGLAILPAPATAQQPAVPRTSAARPAQAGKPEAQPTWAELSPAQQQALAPLTSTWASLSAAHKRKWLALSANYGNLPAPEQERLHSRMREWALLSPQQRTQARLNFAETKKVAPADKRAQWEAYQALPPEEKRRLAEGAKAAKPPPPPTAPAVKPVPQQKLARVPRKRTDRTRAEPAVPGQVDRNTLLPKPNPGDPTAP